jgi:hypothetical protein
MRSIPIVCAIFFSFASCTKDQPGTLPDPTDSGVDPSADSGVVILDAGTINMPAYTNLRIAPQNPVLVVTNGVPAAQDFELFGTPAATGVEEKIAANVLWRTNDDRIGAFSSETTPRYTANGDRSGTAVIEAHVMMMVVSTSIRVELAMVHTENGAPNDAETKFTGPAVNDPARAASIVYPNDRAMIPKNLVPMLIQWDAPAGVDLFRAKLSAPNVTATVYTGGREVKISKEAWTKLLEAAAGSQVVLEVAGVNSASPAEVFLGPNVTLDIADTQMRGTIYYWAVNVGRILRIRPGAETYEDFFTPPPAADGNTCVGCHTLSRDGSRMAFEYYGGWQSSGIVDVLAPNPPLIMPGIIPANFSAYNASGDRLLTALSGVLQIRDPLNGAMLEQLELGGVLGTHPAWSPDGATIAYVSQVPGQAFGDIDFFVSDLSIIRDASGTRMPPEVLVPSNGMASSYPSFSPTGSKIAFMRGPYSRSHTSYDPNAPSAISPADLYIAPIDRSTAEVKLERASAAGQAYLPAYSPFSGAGVTWLAFFSRRDYGNVTKGTGRRQIWVTAIDEGAAPGSDPSHAGFWLPAQDATTENMSAYWAPDPCHSEGSACVLDDDCCGGAVCRPDASGARVCTLRENACREIGELCADNSECCPGTNISCTTTAEGPRCAMTQL